MPRNNGSDSSTTVRKELMTATVAPPANPRRGHARPAGAGGARAPGRRLFQQPGRRGDGADRHHLQPTRPKSRSSRSTPAGCTTRRWRCWIAWSAATSAASRCSTRDAEAIEQYVRDNGINGFYLGLEERQSCCHIRKVEPFKRAIAGHKAWVTGVRREQSAERALGEAGRVGRALRPVESQPAARLDRRGRVGLHQGAQSSVQRAARQRLSRASAARPARARSSRVPIRARAAGGGRTRSRASAACSRVVASFRSRSSRVARPRSNARRASPDDASHGLLPDLPAARRTSRCWSSAAAKSPRARSICCCAPARRSRSSRRSLIDSLAREAAAGDDHARRRRISARASGRHAAGDRGHRQAVASTRGSRIRPSAATFRSTSSTIASCRASSCRRSSIARRSSSQSAAAAMRRC